MHTLWMDTVEAQPHPRLAGDLRADVAVVGAGIAGTATAWLLQQAGMRVVLVEAGEVGGGETCHTSAHLTAVQDTRWYEIARIFGASVARRLARAGMEAIDRVERLAAQIDCDFARVPGWLFTESRRDLRELEREARAAEAAGLDVDLVGDVPLPFETVAGLRFEGQAVFHPLRFVRGLARAFVEAGGQIFTRSRVIAVSDGRPARIRTASGSVAAREVVLATDAPIHDRFRMHARISPFRTYVATAPVAQPLEGLFWDTADPYHYLRSWNGPDGPVAIVGGEDHRVGTVEDTEERYDRLARWMAPRLGVEPDRFWSGQVNEPADGLPFIGRNPFSVHVHVATGFSGTGLVNGLIAAEILAANLQGKRHPLSRPLAATRVKPLAQAKEAIVHNVGTAGRLIGDRIASPSEVGALEDVPRGEGRIVRHGGERLAVFRDDDGTLRAVSPVCTHLGCYVRWNAGERSWDCPCHGSRFDTAGRVIHGPAMRALAPRELPEEERRPPAAPSWEQEEQPGA